jgi:ribose-phosphate pyrophosphokinase
VIVDDIASSGATILAAAAHLADQGFGAPVCVVVHALLGRAAEAGLTAAGCRLVSADTVPHATNQIPVAEILADALIADSPSVPDQAVCAVPRPRRRPCRRARKNSRLAASVATR